MMELNENLKKLAATEAMLHIFEDIMNDDRIDNSLDKAIVMMRVTDEKLAELNTEIISNIFDLIRDYGLNQISKETLLNSITTYTEIIRAMNETEIKKYSLELRLKEREKRMFSWHLRRGRRINIDVSSEEE